MNSSILTHLIDITYISYKDETGFLIYNMIEALRDTYILRGFSDFKSLKIPQRFQRYEQCFEDMHSEMSL